MDKANRKKMLDLYKEKKQIGGIYQIRNIINNKLLILSSTNLDSCKNRFDFSQKTDSCVSMKLQDDWNLYGAKSFEFEILEEIEKKEEQSHSEFNDEIKLLEEMWTKNYAMHYHDL